MQDRETRDPHTPDDDAVSKVVTSDLPPVAPEGSTAEEDEADAKPSAMVDEGDRPASAHGSVEGLESADRPGGMAGEG